MNNQTAPFGLSADALGRLVLIDADGVRHIGVDPVRSFPITDPQRWISIRDSRGKEVAFVEDLKELHPPTRRTLEEELARREFIPQLKRIVRMTNDTPPIRFDVETDRGPTEFLLNSEDDIRRLGPNTFLIVDSAGVRYLIANYSALDAHSRRWLDRVL
ncbi:MAG TPA: DUF1854 domain-containing protein [Pirellulales bacterium]|jgi:hypothetical protein|nr:DUF1854 domain-containing protein [Pirellulales bacterium]